MVNIGKNSHREHSWDNLKESILQVGKTIAFVSTCLMKTFPSSAQDNKVLMNHNLEYTQMQHKEFTDFLWSYVDHVHIERSDYSTIYRISDTLTWSTIEDMSLSIHMITKFERCPSKKWLKQWETIYKTSDTWREIDFIPYDQVEIFKVTYQYIDENNICIDVVELYNDHLLPLAKLHTWNQDGVLKKTVHLFNEEMSCYNKIVVLFALNMLPNQMKDCIKEWKKQEKNWNITNTFELDKRLRKQ